MRREGHYEPALLQMFAFVPGRSWAQRFRKQITGGRDAQQVSLHNPFLGPADENLKRLQRKRCRAEESAFVTPEVSRA